MIEKMNSKEVIFSLMLHKWIYVPLNWQYMLNYEDYPGLLCCVIVKNETQNMFFKEVQLILTNSTELLKIHGVEALVLEVKHMHIWLWSMCRESLDIPWISSGKLADCSGWRTNAWKEIKKITESCAAITCFDLFLKVGDTGRGVWKKLNGAIIQYSF